jgi:hypothetical protein
LEQTDRCLSIFFANLNFFKQFCGSDSSNESLIAQMKEANLRRVYFDEQNEINSHETTRVSLDEVMHRAL